MTRRITSRTFARHTAALAFLVTAGCASAPGAKPDDMSAEEHRKVAAEQRAARSEHAAQYDPTTEGEYYSMLSPDEITGTVSSFTYNPTEQHLRHASEYKEHAADHEAAAKTLEAFEAAECGQFPAETRRTCPLMGKIAAAQELNATAVRGQAANRKGIRIRFADGVNRDAVIAHMRCHIAFGRTQGRKGMDHCPLYVEGVSLQSQSGAPSGGGHGAKGHNSTKGGPRSGGDTHGPGHAAGKVYVEPGAPPNTVDLLVDDQALVEELLRRAKAHMPGWE